MSGEKEITNASTGLTPEDLGGSGPSTDLSTKDFPPGTTSVDDGVPKNIKGQVTQGAPAGDPYAAFGGVDVHPAAPAKEGTDPYAEFGGVDVAPKQTEPQSWQAKVGAYLNDASQHPTLTNLPARVAGSAASIASIPFDMYHAFADPASQAEKAQILAKIRQENAERGTTDPNNPNHIPDSLAMNPSQATIAYHRLVDAPASDLSKRGDNALDAARDLWDKGDRWKGANASASGAVYKIESAVPILGPMLQGIADKMERGDIAGGLTDIYLLHQFGKADEAAKAKIKEHLGIQPEAPVQGPAPPPGVIDKALDKASQILATPITRSTNAAERIGQAAGNVAARVPGVRSAVINSDLKAAAKDHVTATEYYDARMAELDRARQQAADAHQKTVDVWDAVNKGTATLDDAAKAETNASEARANATKAEKAAVESSTRKFAAEQKLESATRRAKSIQRPTEFDAEQQQAAHQDITEAIPPTTARKGQYTPEDMTRINPYITEAHAENSPANIEGVRDMVQGEVDRIDDQLAPTIDKYRNEPLKVTSVNGDPASITQAVIEHLQDGEQLPEGFINEATKELEKYDIANPSLRDANELRKRLVKENRATASENSWDVADARVKDPAFAAREALYDVLREGIHGRLEDLGVKGSESLRQDQAALIRFKYAADRAIRSGEVAKKGSSPAGPVAKLAATALKRGGGLAGAGVGAAIGGTIGGDVGAELGAAAGAPVGHFVGGKVAEAIAAPDLTRNQQAIRGLDALQQTGPRPTLDLTGAQDPATAPPVHPRENSPLHTELTHYYDEDAGETPYAELESRFMRDYKRKIQSGLKDQVTTQESNIHKQIVQERYNELKAAQDAADQAIKDAADREKEEAKTQQAIAKQAAADAEKVKQQAAANKKQAEAKQTLGTEDVLRPTGSPMMEASEPVRKIKKDLPNGRTPKQVVGHEFFHDEVADAEGIKSTDIATEDHPDIKKLKGIAGIGWQEQPFAFDESKRGTSPAQMLENTRKWVAIYMGGPAGDELSYGIPFESNSGAAGDIALAKELLTASGITDPDVQEAEIARGLIRASDHLTKPGVLDRVDVEAGAREKGLHPTLHASAARMEEIRKGRKNGKPEGTDNNPSKRQLNERTPIERREERVEENQGASGAAQEGGTEGRVKSESEAARQKEGNRSPLSPAIPAERTTGNAETDAAIKAGGGVPGGKFGDLAMFHHPENGTTMAMRPEGITPESVKEHIGKKTEEYTQGELRNAARQINPDFNGAHVQPDPRESEIADAYKAAKHEPNNPAVKASYDALKRDIDSQYDTLKRLGFKMGTADENPYGLSSEIPAHEELHRDVLRNKHLDVWKGGAPPADHPLSEVDPKTGLTYNDKFRMVHDIFGHAAERTDFSPAGEESAWNLHRQLFSPEARPALATETRGQAAYTYKYGDFPPQKAAILPEHLQVRPEDLKAGKSTPKPADVGTARSPLTTDIDHDEVLDNIKRAYGVHDDPKLEHNAGFITPEGRYIDLPSGVDHTDAIEEHGGGPSVTREGGKPVAADNRKGFINDTGTVRVHKARERAGEVLSYSVGKGGVSPEQLDAITKSVGANVNRNGVLRIESADISPETRKELATEKEFPSTLDVKPMLEKIGALRSPLSWTPDLTKEPAGGVNPENPEAESKRYGFEIHPESRQALEQNPTAEDFAKYADQTKDIRGSHPDIKLGWDTTGDKPELNIGASTDDKEKALEMAKKLDQRSVWDNAKGEVIPAGGTGERTQFPEYPMAERLKDLNDVDFKHLPPDLREDMKPEHLDYLRDKPTLQKNVVKEFNKIDPSVEEMANAAKAGRALGGWWQRFIDTFKAMGEPNEAAEMEQIGPSHTEALKAFHGALSGNKAVEAANKMAWGVYKDWLDQGRPRDVASINQIIADNNGITDWVNNTGRPYKLKNAKGEVTKVVPPGEVIKPGLDATKVWKLVNSPQMRDVNPVPFTGNAFIDSPVAGVSPGAKKIPSMVATTAGEGNLDNTVFDTHMKDLYGQSGLTDAKYIADSIHVRRAARQLGLKPGEGQEQMWGTVLAIKNMLGDNLSPEEIADQFGDEHVAAIGKDYAKVILESLENDPEFREILDGLSKHGFSPTSEKSITKLKDIVAEGQSRFGQTNPEDIDRALLAKTAERLGKSVSGYDAEAARNAPSFNFGALAPESALDKLAGKR